MKTVERPRYKDKRVFQVRKLSFEPYGYSENTLGLVMGLIRKNLTPGLLTPKYREENKTNSMFGHCYHSSQALFYLMNTDQLQPMSAEDYRGEKHWWLQSDEKIYDPTADQYYSVGKLPPYETGKKSRWYGWKQRPQQISLDLMIKVLGNRLIEDTLITVH